MPRLPRTPTRDELLHILGKQQNATKKMQQQLLTPSTATSTHMTVRPPGIIALR